MAEYPRVFVIHEATALARDGVTFTVDKDLSPAERFGELVRVVGAGPVHDLDSAVAAIEAALDDVEQQDYLLFVGNSELTAVAGAVAAWNLGGRFHYLKWCKAKNEYDGEGNFVRRIHAHYEPCEVTIPSMLDDFEENE
jgi:hypothetical protein